MTGTAALLVERGRTHGDFDDNAAVAQGRSARWQRLNVAQAEALEMVIRPSGIIGPISLGTRRWWRIGARAKATTMPVTVVKLFLTIIESLLNRL